MNGLGYLQTLENGDHPAIVDLFADSGSIFHLSAGFVTGLLPDLWALAGFSAFIGYQVSQATTGESWQRTGGEFIEFAIGIALSQIFQMMGGKL